MAGTETPGSGVEGAGLPEAAGGPPSVGAISVDQLPQEFLRLLPAEGAPRAAEQAAGQQAVVPGGEQAGAPEADLDFGVSPAVYDAESDADVQATGLVPAAHLKAEREQKKRWRDRYRAWETAIETFQQFGQTPEAALQNFWAGVQQYIAQRTQAGQYGQGQYGGESYQPPPAPMAAPALTPTGLLGQAGGNSMSQMPPWASQLVADVRELRQGQQQSAVQSELVRMQQAVSGALQQAGLSQDRAARLFVVRSIQADPQRPVAEIIQEYRTVVLPQTVVGQQVRAQANTLTPDFRAGAASTPTQQQFDASKLSPGQTRALAAAALEQAMSGGR